MTRLFGSDGIKGIANKDLTAELAFKLGQALVSFLSENSGEIPKILVGRDTRISGYMLESALVAGLCSMGAMVESVGIIPSPAVAFLVKKYKMTAGVSISASHKPMEYNGIKFFDNEGYKLTAQDEDKIEAFATGKLIMPPIKTGGELGKISRTHTALRDYVDLIKLTVGGDLSGMKVAIDCANGAAYQCAKLCFKELGADVEMLNNVPNGININDNCGSSHIDGLMNFVVSNNCSFGIAMDGDGDHLLACDEKGKLIDSKRISEICGVCHENHSSAKDGLVMAVSLAGAYKKSGLPMSKL
ncbi:MAG: hypothetical protein J6R68_07395 [Clostridia bacterium]|nr:hypothetical protein [Clostridia bacterium]MBO7289642.1 hypothetical protein [Clostridia bacterium]